MFDTDFDVPLALTEREIERVFVEHEEELLPLAEMPTGGWLGVELEMATPRPSDLDDADLVDAVIGFERLTAWAQARQAALLAEFARRRPSDSEGVMSPYAADEIGLALRLAYGTASARLMQAQRLDNELIGTRQAWQDGKLDSTKVRAVLDRTANLEPAVAIAVQDRVLTRAPQQTAGQLRAALGRAVIAADPAGAAERQEKARSDRRVAINPEADGMASLWALLPAPDAVSAYEWLTRLARGMGVDDPRGMDARRADLLTALLTGRLTVGAPDGGGEQVPMPEPVNPGKPLVQVVVPYDTLTGAAEHPGELVGYGSIPAPLAREIAADAVWKRLVTDPLSGALLDHGRTTYRPPAALADYIRARDVHCRHPGCRRRAIDAELDHTVAFASDGGSTAASNLAGVCAHHHHLKHDAPGWTVRQDPDGTITWTTPTGHSYSSDPYDYRVEPGPDVVAHVVAGVERRRSRLPEPPPPAVDAEPPF